MTKSRDCHRSRPHLSGIHRRVFDEPAAHTGAARLQDLLNLEGHHHVLCATEGRHPERIPVEPGRSGELQRITSPEVQEEETRARLDEEVGGALAVRDGTAVDVQVAPLSTSTILVR